MAVHKATRSNPSAQSACRRPHPQFKAEIFEILRHLNRGYGVALAALDKLDIKDRSQSKTGLRMFTSICLREYRNRTEALQAEANRDLLRLVAGHEERAALMSQK